MKLQQLLKPIVLTSLLMTVTQCSRNRASDEPIKSGSENAATTSNMNTTGPDTTMGANTTTDTTTSGTMPTTTANSDTANTVDGGAGTPTTTTRKADNTGVNARDRDNKTLTAEDQAGSTPQAVELTRLIRQELMNHSELSTYAQNIKIITAAGKVTLRGPVRSETERTTVASIAEKVAGQKNVKNNLDIVN